MGPPTLPFRPWSGTAEANSIVTVFDGATRLGGATANGSGAWNFATVALATGIHKLHGHGDGCGGEYQRNLVPVQCGGKRTGGRYAGIRRVSNCVVHDRRAEPGDRRHRRSRDQRHRVGAVAFTVSGLEAGALGEATFTDIAGHQVVVDVANGTYSADLSTLTDGTITSLLSPTNPAGHTATASGNTVFLDTTAD